jgi:gamma-glutamyltranspeptidase/glutathione hydrolase
MLHNRGGGFRLDPQHPNGLGPRKRPLHTLIPAMALRDGKPMLVFGSRGADGQPQTQVQVLSNVLDFEMNPQQAVEAPRWVHGGPARHHPPNAVVLESRMPDLERLVSELEGRGHQVVVSEGLDLGMGTAQAIQLDHARGVLMAGSDPRGDGAAIGW